MKVWTNSKILNTIYFSKGEKSTYRKESIRKISYFFLDG